MRHEFKHSAWTNATVKNVEAERRGYERARERLPNLKVWVRNAIAISSTVMFASLAAGALLDWVWLIPGLGLTVIGLGAMLVNVSHEVSRAIPPSNNLDLRELKTDELEALQMMASQEPEIANSVARWIADERVLRLRDLEACQMHFAETADAREERAIKRRLATPGRFA